MKKSWLIIWVCMLLTTPLAADFVYMNSGKVYEGKVTRKGDRVLVEMAYGTIELKASDVHTIEKAEITTKPQDSALTPPPEKPADKPFRVGNATRPEPMAFGFMRVLTTTAAGEESFNMRKQVQRWQDAAHDRMRKIGTQWYSPKDFETHRTAFARKYAEAHEAFRGNVRRYGSDPATEKKRQKLRIAAATKALAAARVWPDLLLRRFLSGIAEYHADNFAPAEVAFRLCRREAPLVAAFHQAHGMALLKVDRPLDALEAFTEALRLESGSKDALTQLLDAMKAVPAVQTRTETYAKAKQLADQYEEPKSTSTIQRRAKWLLPGKVKQSRADILPVPAYDRLNFTQAVAIPVGESALIVDAKAVKNASEVYLRVAEGRYVPARVSRSVLPQRGKIPVPMAIITVADVVLTPLKLAGTEQFKPNLKAVAYTLPLYTSMGTNVTAIEMVTSTAEEEKTMPLAGRLAAGDATSPVMDADGRLLGFLTGKTDVTVSGGGDDKFIGPEALGPVIKRAAGLRARGYGYGASKRTFTPEPVKDAYFVIYAVECETVK